MISQDDALARALGTLSATSEHVVAVGGIGLRLLSSHPRAIPLGRGTLATTDLDVAVATTAPRVGPLGSLLQSQGFTWEPRGTLRPPKIEYVIETVTGPFRVEFLAQRKGSSIHRDGSENATLLRLGVSVALLPHIWPALEEPWTVTHDRGDGTKFDLSVINPASFIVQKLLSIGDRKRIEKQEKDLLQIVDAIRMFGDELPEFRALVDALRARLTRSEAATLAQQVNRLTTPGDLHAGAVLQARQAGASENADVRVLASTCRAGLDLLQLR